VRSLGKGFETITLEWDEGFNGGYDKTTYNVEYKEIGGGSSNVGELLATSPDWNSTQHINSK